MSEDLRQRLGGLFLLVIGMMIGWWAIWRPLQAARAQAPEVHYSLKLFLLAPMCLVFGLFLLMFGSSIPYRDAERQRLTAVGWIIFAVAGIITALGYFWFQHMFTSLGYGDSQWRP